MSALVGRLEEFTPEEVEARAERLWTEAEEISRQALVLPWWRLGKSAGMIRESWAMKDEAQSLLGVAAFIRTRGEA